MMFGISLDTVMFKSLLMVTTKSAIRKIESIASQT
jgi:hypothetical protein